MNHDQNKSGVSTAQSVLILGPLSDYNWCSQQGGMNLNQDQQGGGDSGYGGNQNSGYGGGQGTDTGYEGGQGTDTGYGGGQGTGYGGRSTDTGYGGGDGQREPLTACTPSSGTILQQPL